MRTTALLILVLCLFAMASLTRGGDAATAARPAGNSAPRPHLEAPMARGTPRVDASPDDPAWESAAVIAALDLSLSKNTEKLAPVGTQVKVLWDAKWLYVRFICKGDEIYSPFTQHGDKLYQGDVVEVFIDPKGDGRQWMETEVSPNNVTLDVMTTLTAEPKWDENLLLAPEIVNRDFWPNLQWTFEGMRSAATVQREGEKVVGWTVDMALPANVLVHRLGLKELAPMTMRANFLRYEYARPAEPGGKRAFIAMNWSPVMYGSPHVSPGAMGYLTLVGNADPGTHTK